VSSRPRLRGAPRAAVGEWFLLLLPLAFSAFVYRRLPHVYFFADDFLNLFRIVNDDLVQYLLLPHGGHLLATRNALFFAFYWAFGMHPEYYFWVVLITHLVNVYLLFRTIRWLTGSARLGVFGAVLWGTCPVQVGALGWYSVYGEVVVGSILLLLLSRAARAGAQERPPSRHSAVTWPLLLLVASTCFGVGIGIALAAPLAFFLLLPPSPRRTRLCIGLTLLAAVLPILYTAMLSLSTELFGPNSEAFVADLMMSHVNVEPVLLMLPQLFIRGFSALLLGFLPLVPSLRDLVSWSHGVPYAAALLYAAAMIAALVGSPAADRRRLAALLLIATSAYGIIALGRAPFFETWRMAEAASPARYHYVATAPLVAALCLFLARVGAWVRARARIANLALAAWLGVTAFLYAQSRPFVSLHAAARHETIAVWREIAAQIDEAPGEEVFIRNRPFHSVGSLVVGDRVGFPGWAAMFAAIFPSDVVRGKRVYFVVDDPEVLEAAQRGKRMPDLLVGPQRAAEPEPAPADSGAPA